MNVGFSIGGHWISTKPKHYVTLCETSQFMLLFISIQHFRSKDNSEEVQAINEIQLIGTIFIVLTLLVVGIGFYWIARRHDKQTAAKKE